MSSGYYGTVAGGIADANGRHFPSGYYTDVTYGNGGPSRHKCGGCGAPIVSRLEAWVHALTGAAACPGNTTASDETATAAGTSESEMCDSCTCCTVAGCIPSLCGEDDYGRFHCPCTSE